MRRKSFFYLMSVTALAAGLEISPVSHAQKYSRKVVVNADRVSEVEKALEDRGVKILSFPRYDQKEGEKLNDNDLVTELGVGDYHLSSPNKEDVASYPIYRKANPKSPVLLTRGVVDSVAIALFDKETEKSALYHASKMELGPNDFGEKIFETRYLPEIKKFFEGTNPEIYLISGYYSKDLSDIVKLMQGSGMTIKGVDSGKMVLDVETTPDEVKKTVSITPEEVGKIDEETGDLKKIPSTRVIMDKKTGEIYVDRNG